jgi:hypothetical protein
VLIMHVPLDFEWYSVSKYTVLNFHVALDFNWDQFHFSFVRCKQDGQIIRMDINVNHFPNITGFYLHCCNCSRYILVREL